MLLKFGSKPQGSHGYATGHTVLTLAIESTADPIAVDVVDIGDRRPRDFVASQGLISMISIEFEVLYFIIC